MKVTFNGSPEEIRREMIAWLGDKQTRLQDLIEKPYAPPTLGEKILKDQREPIDPLILSQGISSTSSLHPDKVIRAPKVVPPEGETQPQQSADGACPYCGKSGKGSKRISGSHMNYCKQNPNRKVHSRAGQMNPGLQKWMEKNRPSGPSDSLLLSESESSEPSEISLSLMDDGKTSPPSPAESASPTSSGDRLPESMDFEEDSPF